MNAIMWIARDLNGRLYMYERKPEKGQSMWFILCCNIIELPKRCYPEIKWDDPEPTKVQIKIIK